VGGRLTVRLSREIERLSPLLPAGDEGLWVTGMFYSGLTRLDDRQTPQPDLAESWSIADDGLVITFTLRPDLRWSDGVPLTAEDVRFTWSLLRTWELRTGVQADLHEYVATIMAPDARTVVFVLRRRLAALLSDVAFPVLPRHVWRETSSADMLEGDLLEKPVGSGPFVLAERRPGEALVLGRNPHYHGPTAFFEQVAFLVAPDPQLAVEALREGDLLVAKLPRTAYDALERDPPEWDLLLGWHAAPQYTFVGFNMHPGHPLQDVRLRQAWAYALDKEALVATATAGEGVPLWSPILPPNWAYDGDLPPLERDLERARDLLTEAGWQDEDEDGVVEKDGLPLQLRLFVRADAPERLAACRRMADQLAGIGMAVEVIPGDFRTVIEAKLRPPYDFDALCMQWRNLSPDPDLFYLFHSSQAWQGPEDRRTNLYNFVGYRSDEADALLLDGRDHYDTDERRAFYVEIQRILAQDLPYYLLWADPVYLVGDGRLTTADGPLNLAAPNPFWNVERWYIER
jgi:peptide/nickel transport system substrate-binding protein